MERVNIAIFVISLLVLCLLIIIHPFAEDYQNTTPDIGRWFEYTLTAPVQVLLVALSVWSRDRSTLYALFAAQASMMLCGVVMEECIEEIYENNATEDEDAPSDKRKRVVRTARGTLVIAWVTFALIWYVLISQFLRQGHIDGKCDDCGSYIEYCPYQWDSATNTFNNKTKSTFDPKASYASFFSAHLNTTIKATDATDTAHVLNATQIHDKFCKACPTKAPDDMCKIAEDQCVGRSNTPPAVSYIVFAQCLLFASFGIVQTIQYVSSSMVETPAERQNAWYAVSIAYAVLSVTAKTTLEIAFLAMLAQMPESVVSA
jgi:ferredoxin